VERTRWPARDAILPRFLACAERGTRRPSPYTIMLPRICHFELFGAAGLLSDTEVIRMSCRFSRLGGDVDQMAWACPGHGCHASSWANLEVGFIHSPKEILNDENQIAGTRCDPGTHVLDSRLCQVVRHYDQRAREGRNRAIEGRQIYSDGFLPVVWLRCWISSRNVSR
jgi:hypothetical protein